MARHALTQRRKAQKEQSHRWELTSGSRVWCYLRHSPGDSQTIDSQVAGMQEWCNSNGWQIDRMFIDEAIEGSREDRAQFQLMISLARQDIKHVDGIALWSFSRFARDQLDAQFYKAELRKRGYVIVSKIDDIPSGEMAPIYEAFIDWKNQRFLEDLSADVKRGLSFVVDQGYWPGGVPPKGYRVEKVAIGQRRNGDIRYGNRLVKDESMAERIALAWKMKIEENASYLQIHEATHIYSDSKHYSDFFDNLIYTGIFVYHGKRFPAKWEDGECFCEPYITLEDYLRVQSNRQKRLPKVIHPRSLASPYLLTGLLHCGVCATNGKHTVMVGQTDNRRPDTRLYRCSTKIRSRGIDCTLPRIPCWRLDEMAIDVLRQTVLTPDYVQAEVERANKLLLETNSDIEPQLEEAMRYAKEQQKKVENIVELIGKQGVTVILEAQYNSANQAWLEATSRVGMLKSQIASENKLQLSLEEANQYLNEMLTVLDQGSINEKQRLIKQFIEHIDVFPDRVDVKLNFQIDVLSTKIDGAWYELAATYIEKDSVCTESLTGLWEVPPRRYTAKGCQIYWSLLFNANIVKSPGIFKADGHVIMMPALIVTQLNGHIEQMDGVNAVMINGGINFASLCHSMVVLGFYSC